MIFVYEIDPNLDEPEIERALSSLAKVKTVAIGENKKTAYVTFYTKVDRDMVLNM